MIDQSGLRIAQIEAYDLIKFLRKNGGLGSLEGIWGQNPTIFKPRPIIYQNEALGALITKKGFSRSPNILKPGRSFEHT